MRNIEERVLSKCWKWVMADRRFYVQLSLPTLQRGMVLPTATWQATTTTSITTSLNNHHHLNLIMITMQDNRVDHDMMQAQSSRKQITFLDGGMGHELKRRGIISDGSFLAGVLANENASANIVESVHIDYLAAGCDVITTNSFVAIPQRMNNCGVATNTDTASRASQLIASSVDRARAAISKHKITVGDRNKKPKKIAGCIPPLTECYLSNLVPLSVDSLMSDYSNILSTLLNCNVDVLLAETLSTSREAQAILRSYHCMMNEKTDDRRFLPPLWISFTIHDDNPTMLRSNEQLKTVCKSIIDEAAHLQLPLEAIGINCSTPAAISQAVPIVARLVEGTNMEVCAYGNCFKTTTSEWIRSTGRDNNEIDSSGPEKQINQIDSCSNDYDEDGYLLPDVYAKFACDWAQSGAQIIGGCCGCGPIHMKKVTALLRDYSESPTLRNTS